MEIKPTRELKTFNASTSTSQSKAEEIIISLNESVVNRLKKNLNYLNICLLTYFNL